MRIPSIFLPPIQSQALDPKLVLRELWDLLSEKRKARILEVVPRRLASVHVVTESLYDRGNVSAVMRTAEALGFLHFHNIETHSKFKVANRVVQGADKWLFSHTWRSTSECIQYLKNKKHRILVTCLDPEAKPLSQVDFSSPCAVVMGSEKWGASPEMISAADEKIFIPMSGFVQSFNISVAAALCLYEASRAYTHKVDLSVEEQELLQAHYVLSTLQASGPQILARALDGRM